MALFKICFWIIVSVWKTVFLLKKVLLYYLSKLFAGDRKGIDIDTSGA